jgi:hypothetical protein
LGSNKDGTPISFLPKKVWVSHLSGVNITWIFNGVRGGDIGNIKKEFFNKIVKDPTVLKPHIELSKNKKLIAQFEAAENDASKMEDFLINDVKQIIDRVFQQGKNLTDISQ